MKTGFPEARRAPRAWRLRAAAALGSLVLVFLVPLACGNVTSLSGPGEECFAATDCQAGLVCVPQREGSRVCSSDLTMVAGRPPPEAGVAESDGGPDGPTEGAVTDGAPAQDTSVPDTSVADTGGG